MAESFAYLGALLFSLGGLGLADYRYRLVLWRDARAGLICIGLGVGGFVLWDLAGIGLNIFYSGDSPYVTGWQLAPHLPVEEIVFLTLLCYLPLLLWNLLGRRNA